MVTGCCEGALFFLDSHDKLGVVPNKRPLKGRVRFRSQRRALIEIFFL